MQILFLFLVLFLTENYTLNKKLVEVGQMGLSSPILTIESISMYRKILFPQKSAQNLTGRVMQNMEKIELPNADRVSMMCDLDIHFSI